MTRRPLYALEDWHPSLGISQTDWLADQYEAGWMPRYPWPGAPITLHGQHVVRWALLEAPDLDPSAWPEPGIPDTAVHPDPWAGEHHPSWTLTTE